MTTNETTMENSAPDIPCVDEWPPGMCTFSAMLAYKSLELDGRIIIQRVEVGRYTARVVIRYLADMPQEWVRELLSITRRELEVAE